MINAIVILSGLVIALVAALVFLVKMRDKTEEELEGIIEDRNADIVKFKDDMIMIQERNQKDREAENEMLKKDIPDNVDDASARVNDMG